MCIIFVLLDVLILLSSEFRVWEIFGFIDVKVFDFSLVLYFCLINFGRFGCINLSYVRIMKFFKDGFNFLFFVIRLL